MIKLRESIENLRFMKSGEMFSLTKTAKPLEKKPNRTGKVSSSNHPFSGACVVSFREGIHERCFFLLMVLKFGKTNI